MLMMQPRRAFNPFPSGRADAHCPVQIDIDHVGKTRPVGARRRAGSLPRQFTTTHRVPPGRRLRSVDPLVNLARPSFLDGDTRHFGLAPGDLNFLVCGHRPRLTQAPVRNKGPGAIGRHRFHWCHRLRTPCDEDRRTCLPRVNVGWPGYRCPHPGVS